jgi:uncharacterized integral membrane protein
MDNERGQEAQEPTTRPPRWKKTKWTILVTLGSIWLMLLALFMVIQHDTTAQVLFATSFGFVFPTVAISFHLSPPADATTSAVQVFGAMITSYAVLIPYKAWQQDHQGVYQINILESDANLVNLTISFKPLVDGGTPSSASESMASYLLRYFLNHILPATSSQDPDETTPALVKYDKWLAHNIVDRYSQRSVIALGQTMVRYAQERKLLAQERMSLETTLQQLKAETNKQTVKMNTIQVPVSAESTLLLSPCSIQSTIECKLSKIGQGIDKWWRYVGSIFREPHFEDHQSSFKIDSTATENVDPVAKNQSSFKIDSTATENVDPVVKDVQIQAQQTSEVVPSA